MNKKIVVAMSGGVDSSITALLLKKQGREVTGVSFKFINNQDWQTAKKVCQKLGIRHYVIDARSEFKKEVVGYFKSELKKGRTPNPCVICNPKIKFKSLIDFADKNKIRYIATGHYARVTKRLELKVAKDLTKDQTYTLSQLPEEWLKRIVLPLGEYTKKEIYNIARKNGFEFFDDISQSQDFCFLKNTTLENFIKQELKTKQGNIVDEQGKLLGKHNGINFFTIGQRKGILLGNGPYYVKDINSENSQVIVTKDKNNLLNKKVKLSKLNLLKNIKSEMVQARIRYRHPLERARLTITGKTAIIEFEKAQEAVTPGQFCVFYSRNVCLGSGIIEK